MAEGFKVNPPLVIGFLPVPASASLCGEPRAESTIERLAVSGLRSDGVNVTVMVQLAPAKRTAPQPWDSVKSEAFAPEIPNVDRDACTGPVLVTSTVCGTLCRIACAPHESEGGLKDNWAGCGAAGMLEPEVDETRTCAIESGVVLCGTIQVSLQLVPSVDVKLT